MTLSSGDTDVFVCLLYNSTVSWNDPQRALTSS